MADVKRDVGETPVPNDKPCANCGREKFAHVLVVSGESVAVLVCPRCVYDPER